jgi:hypothetical protein
MNPLISLAARSQLCAIVASWDTNGKALQKVTSNFSIMF